MGAALSNRHLVPGLKPKITFCPHFVRFGGKIPGYWPAHNPVTTLGTYRNEKDFMRGRVRARDDRLVVRWCSPARAMEIAGSNGADDAAINIPRIKSVLKLTPAQEQYWAPVEAALRDLARRQSASSESTGLVRRISNRVVTVVLNSAAVQRLAVAARPLIGTLDAEQMRAAQGLAQEMGLGTGRRRTAITSRRRFVAALSPL